jgi:hypothetical protein
MNEFDGLEFTVPGPNGSSVLMAGETFRKVQLKINYDSDFKWAVLGAWPHV